jgi:hypothetical protein
MEIFKGNQMCLNRVLDEISESMLLSKDSVSTFLHPLWDRNMMWSSGQPGIHCFEVLTMIYVSLFTTESTVRKKVSSVLKSCMKPDKSACFKTQSK